MHVVDGRGRELEVGAKVKGIGGREGIVWDPAAPAIVWAGTGVSARHSARRRLPRFWIRRCNDLELIDPEEEN